MKVLHVVSSLDPAAGGPVAALVGLATAQLDQGAEVSVLSTFTEPLDESVALTLRRAGADVRLVGPARGPLQSHPALAGAMREAVAASDVVHIHAVWEEIQHQAARGARAARKPYVFRTCGMLDPWQLAHGALKKRAYLALRLRRDLNGASLLHYTSREEERLVRPLRLKPACVVEANGVRLDEFQTLPPRSQCRARHAFGDDERVLLFLSRIHPKKGLDLLVPALHQMDTPCRLIIAGPDEGGYRARVEEMVRRHTLQDRVTFTGPVGGLEKLTLLAAADLFVLPSYQENFGNAVIESLAAGTPVVITDQVNIHEQIRVAGLGGVVPTDVAALAGALDEWLTNEVLRDIARSNARPFVARHFNWEQIAARWRARYEELPGPGPARREWVP